MFQTQTLTDFDQSVWGHFSANTARNRNVSYDLLKKILHTLMSFQICKTFVHLQNTNGCIFDEIRELS